jgi:2-polyprenyl-3-methyl-5-hydroxy-6-metoxy-1,4-benzoquinol methylase
MDTKPDRSHRVMHKYLLTPCQRSCPVCYFADARILWKINSTQAAQHFVLKEVEPERYQGLVAHIEKLWGQDNCEVVQCNNCGFCYSNPYIGGDERFYTLAYDRSKYPSWKWEHQLTYDVLLKQIKPGNKILEIGAGDGAFVKRIAPKLIPKEHVICTEFSEYGNHRIKEYGITCLTKDFRDFNTLDLKEHFDIICMFQILEHLDQLDIVFQKLNWLIKSGGSLFISVPDPKRTQFQELNGALLDMPPNHIGRWNRSCFEEIGKRWQFDVKEYKIEYSSFISVAQTLFKYRFLRRSQQAGTLANRTFNIKTRHLRKAIQAIIAGFDFIKGLPILSKIEPCMGMSNWAHLVKTE